MPGIPEDKKNIILYKKSNFSLQEIEYMDGKTNMIQILVYQPHRVST